MGAASENLGCDSLNSIASKDTTSQATVVWLLVNLFTYSLGGMTLTVWFLGE